MKTGYALGGPRDGVKLSAGNDWDGRVLKKKNKNCEVYHSGNYVWYAVTNQWMWNPTPRESTKPYRKESLRGQRL